MSRACSRLCQAAPMIIVSALLAFPSLNAGLVKKTYAATPLRQNLLDDGIKNCRAIDSQKYVTGLLFNGPGMHTWYERAYCFRELAARERDMSLCRFVTERRSLFFDGSRVSSAVCEQQVAAAIKGDQDKALMLASLRDQIIESTEVIGILEYDKVTASRSLILRGKFKKLNWPYYQYEIEFQGQQGEVLARYRKSPFAQNENDRIFMFQLHTLKNDLAGDSLNHISAIVIRAVLQRNAESAHVMSHVGFDELDVASINDSGFGSIPLRGTIKHDQWLDLLAREGVDTAAFLDQLDKLTAR